MTPDTLLTKAMDLFLDGICAVDASGRVVYTNATFERMLGYDCRELQGAFLLELVHPDDRARTQQAANDVLTGSILTDFHNRYLGKDGRVVELVWSSRWSEEEQLRLAIARDVTALRRAQRQQQATYQISEAAHQAASLPELYEHIHHIVGQLLPADNFFVALHDRDDNTLNFPYFVDARSPCPPSQPLDDSMPIAHVIRKGEPLLLHAGEKDRQGNTRLGDCLGAPLKLPGGVIGAVVVHCYDTDSRYSEEDKELLCFVSSQIALAIERKRNEERLRHMAQHDPLTSLPNRSLFYEHVDVAIRRAERHGETLGLLYLDLNQFKQINDSLEHATGDALLCDFASRLRRCVRDSDMVGRLGGDEFVVLVTALKHPRALHVVAGKIQQRLRRPCIIDGQIVPISASIGCALYPKDGLDTNSLLAAADRQMYAMKASQSSHPPS